MQLFAPQRDRVGPYKGSHAKSHRLCAYLGQITRWLRPEAMSCLCRSAPHLVTSYFSDTPVNSVTLITQNLWPVTQNIDKSRHRILRDLQIPATHHAPPAPTVTQDGNRLAGRPECLRPPRPAFSGTTRRRAGRNDQYGETTVSESEKCCRRRDPGVRAQMPALYLNIGVDRIGGSTPMSTEMPIIQRFAASDRPAN